MSQVTYHDEGIKNLRRKLRQAERVGVLEVAQAFLATKPGIRATTQANCVYMIVQLHKLAGGRSLDQISAAQLSEWVIQASGTGRGVHLNRAKMILRWAHGGVLPPEIQTLRLPKGAGRHWRLEAEDLLTQEEITCLRDAATNLRDKALIECMYVHASHAYGSFLVVVWELHCRIHLHNTRVHQTTFRDTYRIPIEPWHHSRTANPTNSTF